MSVHDNRLNTTIKILIEKHLIEPTFCHLPTTFNIYDHFNVLRRVEKDHDVQMECYNDLNMQSYLLFGKKNTYIVFSTYSNVTWINIWKFDDSNQVFSECPMDIIHVFFDYGLAVPVQKRFSKFSHKHLLPLCINNMTYKTQKMPLVCYMISKRSAIIKTFLNWLSSNAFQKLKKESITKFANKNKPTREKKRFRVAHIHILHDAENAIFGLPLSKHEAHTM